jgi:thiamine biosynthesis lipoprotein
MNALGSFLLLTLIIIVIFIFSILLNKNASKNTKPSERSIFVFGTIANFKVYGAKAEKAIDEAVMRLYEIDYKISAFKDYSEISKINANSGIFFQKVSPDTFLLIKKAVEYSELLEGTFDPTIRPLVELWGIGTKDADIPSKENIEKSLNLVNYKNIILDEKNCAVKLEVEKQKIDLGGIAKGYAADEVKSIFENNSIRNAIIDLGGNIFVLGGKADGSSWKVGIQDPLRERGTFVGALSLKNKSVVTSGNYERYFIMDGRRYHHIINPVTGYPSEGDIISATIISDKSIDGDGLSTGIYILGKDRAMKLIENMDGIDAILITEDKKIYVSSGIRDKFKLTNDDYICIYN